MDALALRRAVATATPPSSEGVEDYRIVASLSFAYLAVTRTSAPALLVPLSSVPDAVGRRGGGFSLSPASSVSFSYQGRSWHQAAAALECTDANLVDTFLVLTLDLVSRLEATGSVSWSSLLSWVDEWQALLVQSGGLSPEQQLGLWGELWVIFAAAEPDLLVSAWRGPDGDPVDFFLEQIGVEVKVSRRAHVHQISQSQVARPVGDHMSYVLSLWVAPEPARGMSLVELIDVLLAKIADPAVLLKRIAILGYSPQDRDDYLTRYALLELPLWFCATDIPQVRVVDEGVAQLRYVVTLDPGVCCDEPRSQMLWRALGHEAAPLAAHEEDPLP